jgi:hypothetical protein
MANSFFLPGDDCEPAYQNLRDMGHNTEMSEFVEGLWERYQPSHDRHFLQDARNNFQQRFWEMYLYAALQDQGLDPQKGQGAGPDFWVVIDGRRYWVEAVAPRRGEGPDKVPEFDYGSCEARCSPVDEIQLRYANAIDDKAKKWPVWIEKGQVQRGDGYVIAINGRGCNDFFDGKPPFFVKACLGIGAHVIGLDPCSGKVVDSYLEYRNSITKKSGEPVCIAPLLQEGFSHVSGVMHSLAYCWHPGTSLLEGMELLHNPLATIDFPDRAVQGFRRYVFAEGVLTTINPDPAWAESPVIDMD